MRHMRHMRRTGSGGHRGAGAAALVAAVACSVLVLAQTQTRPPEPAATSVGQIQQGVPQPTFRAGVTLVTTDVIPRNRDGVVVSDLGKDDFRVFEDGVEQQVVTMTLVHGGRVYNRLSLPAPVPSHVIPPFARFR